MSISENMTTAIESVEAVVSELETARQRVPGQFAPSSKRAPAGDGFEIASKLEGKLQGFAERLRKLR